VSVEGLKQRDFLRLLMQDSDQPLMIEVRHHRAIEQKLSGNKYHASEDSKMENAPKVQKVEVASGLAHRMLTDGGGCAFEPLETLCSAKENSNGTQKTNASNDPKANVNIIRHPTDEALEQQNHEWCTSPQDPNSHIQSVQAKQNPNTCVKATDALVHHHCLHVSQNPNYKVLEQGVNQQSIHAKHAKANHSTIQASEHPDYKALHQAMNNQCTSLGNRKTQFQSIHASQHPYYNSLEQGMQQCAHGFQWFAKCPSTPEHSNYEALEEGLNTRYTTGKDPNAHRQSIQAAKHPYCNSLEQGTKNGSTAMKDPKEQHHRLQASVPAPTTTTTTTTAWAPPQSPGIGDILPVSKEEEAMLAAGSDAGDGATVVAKAMATGTDVAATANGIDVAATANGTNVVAKANGTDVAATANGTDVAATENGAVGVSMVNYVLGASLFGALAFVVHKQMKKI
jgi:hypothetical protein